MHLSDLRFARTFVQPNLKNVTETILDLLIQTVDAEYMGRSIDDRWGIMQVEMFMSKVDHPYRHCFMGLCIIEAGLMLSKVYLSRCNISDSIFLGNAETLYLYPLPEEMAYDELILPWGRYIDLRKTMLRDELQKFYLKWYSSNIMSLAVVSEGRSTYHIHNTTSKDCYL
jgi:secreted Zn-dependent insulinase-like peptidase